MTDTISAPTADMLVALSRLVTTARLLSGAVHEVNNALLVISGTVELLEARSDLPEGIDRSLERLRRQGSRAAAALAEVTTFTQAPLDEHDEVSLRDVATAAVDLRRFAATRVGIGIDFTPGDPCVVRGNAGYLQQAALNLIIRAEQKSRAVGARTQIAVVVANEGGEAVLRVSDDRPRAPGEESTMFEPFASSHAATDIGALCLFTARAIVESHGGSLTLDDQAAGTSLVMRLPQSRA